jgi:DNA-binding MarR family transcriptional regulator
MVQRMERAGLVTRRHDAEDERLSRVYLTDAGRSIHGAAEAAWRRLEAQAFAGFTADERLLLDDFLPRIQRNLTGPTAEDRSQT